MNHSLRRGRMAQSSRSRPLGLRDLTPVTRGSVMRSSTRMRLIVNAAVAAVAVGAGVACLSTVAATAASADPLRVCPSGCAFTQIAPALAAAKDGDTVKVAGGTYKGGFRILKSVGLVGAGARTTIIRGGGPVVTIGTVSASGKLKVSIFGVTITGGVTHSSPESVLAFGHKAGVLATGGGVQVNPHDVAAGTPETPGATVSISNSVITGNRVAPSATVPSPGGNSCPTGPCPFNQADGGGIYNGGVMTLRDTAVTDNQASGVNGDGGGIYSDGFPAGGSSLTLIDSTVSGNQALAPTAMVGRFAIGGGIEVGMGGALTVMHSHVNDNRATLTSTLPVMAGGHTIDMVANSGGILVDDDSPATIENTTITGNSVTATDPSGPANAINAAGSIGDGRLLMRNTVISHNRVSSTYATDGVSAPSATSFDQGGQGGAFGVSGGGTISHTQIIDNPSSSTSPDGPTAENGGLNVFPPSNPPARLLTVTDSVISGNTATASSPNGSATVQGAGIFNAVLLRLDNDQVRDNSATATGRSGIAEGAGIWNGLAPSTTPVNVTLTLDHTVVTHNSLKASAGLTVKGAGLFTIPPVTLTLSPFTANLPDECSGAAC